MIEIKNLSKKFGSRWVLKDINMSIPAQKITCIVGRSGEGKSVLLKHIMGLIAPTTGSITINNTIITNTPQKNQKPIEWLHKKVSGKITEKKEIFTSCGYVFQFAALLDSLTIFENVALSIIESSTKSAQTKNYGQDLIKNIVFEKLTQVHLNPSEIAYKYPAELSGGMKKRVGIARALINNPSIILYDEPTTGLDPINARMVHELMMNMQQERPVTSVVVSHDTELFKYADYVALLHDGHIAFWGEAQTIWESKNPYIYQFIRGLPNGPIYSDFKDFF